MQVNGKEQRTIWLKPENPSVVQIIDQRFLPHKFVIEDLCTLEDVYIAIKDMHVRGAPLIGAAAGFGVYLGLLEGKGLETCINRLRESRPTARNLFWALELQLNALEQSKSGDLIAAALECAQRIAEIEYENCKKIGLYGLPLIEDLAKIKKGNPVNILTHCNAGWLACIDYGTATSPIYQAFDKGIDLHVWVDETRPRNQGASLTAWELGQHGIPHTVIVDNAGGHLMQHGMVDIVIVGSDRTTRNGDVANKIGTYLKALAAYDNNVPFYVALPSSTIDWNLTDGISQIPIEERDDTEVKYISGLVDDEIKQILLTPKHSHAANFAFDVTPARFVTGLITERGICDANESSMQGLFPMH
ncbi:MAG: S-methyl-5-thioribose-1-phosphate isomerase [Deltaproteobacteria bacterium]|nr:S-methyl-5-thioribose-1-phosphate isomerase [Deltaproteobacteria bacterium]